MTQTKATWFSKDVNLVKKLIEINHWQTSNDQYMVKSMLWDLYWCKLCYNAKLSFDLKTLEEKNLTSEVKLI